MTRALLRHPDIVEEQLDHELLLYVPHLRQTYVLNATAAAVWQLCDGVRDVHAIIATLAQRFAAAEDLLRRDVADILALFQAATLVATA